MDEYESLSHTKWECKYHVVFIPKCRRRTLYEELRQHLGEVFRRLAAQKESRIEEGHLMADHVHMMIAIPPKYAVSQVIGYIKGKSAIHFVERFHVLRFDAGDFRESLDFSFCQSNPLAQSNHGGQRLFPLRGETSPNGSLPALPHAIFSKERMKVAWRGTFAGAVTAPHSRFPRKIRSPAL
jgi:REP element-mobilizing transposase RayT